MKVLEIISKKIPGKLYQILFALGEYFYYRMLYSVPVLGNEFTRKRYFFDGSTGDHEDLARLFRELFSDKVQSKTAEANIICDHVFDLLGSGPVKLTARGSSFTDQKKNLSAMNYEPIDWHRDFKSGYRWNKRIFFRFIRFGKERGVDVKVPWELSRFQHLNVLGQAYLLTHNRKYADEFQNQISDWIENNKVGFGVNWVSTMDVAIRAANWLVAIEYFNENNLLPPAFINRFYTSIYEHARYICRHLEYGPPATNHYLSDIVGLFFISLYCPFFCESEEWKKFCIKEFEKEIEKQVYDDGCSFEGSTTYHMLSMELFFYAALLSEKAGIDFSSSYHKRLKKMFEFLLYCIKPNGRIPQIGDNDNGRFIPLSTRQAPDHTYLLSLAAIYFGDADFKIKAFPYDEEAFWVFGKEGYALWNQLEHRNTKLNSKAFPDAGWYIMRHRDDYCFISCGPNGQNGKGGHNHNDKLSFELILDGKDVIVDPGTYVYAPDPEWRNKFRSTAFHNTIKIGDIEQNDISRDLFEMCQAVECRNCRLDETEDMIVFEGEVKYLDADIIHSREVILYKHTGTLKIFDKIKSLLPCKVLINLCLGNCGANYHISLDKGMFEEAEGFYSKGYGDKTKAVFLRNVTEGCSNFVKETTIRH